LVYFSNQRIRDFGMNLSGVCCRMENNKSFSLE
jgi:hypothetical protein